jgi:hypothetical protein
VVKGSGGGECLIIAGWADNSNPKFCAEPVKTGGNGINSVVPDCGNSLADVGKK